MVLSRFWSFIIAASILYILILLATGRSYTIGHVVNGKQGDAVMIAERPAVFFESNTSLYNAIAASGTTGLQRGDSLYMMSASGSVQIYTGRQQADGIFPTCRNTIMDLWLPLIGYLTFFCGLLNLLSDSNAMQ